MVKQTCDTCRHDCKISSDWHCRAWKPKGHECPFVNKETGVCEILGAADFSPIRLCKDTKDCSMRLNLRNGFSR